MYVVLPFHQLWCKLRSCQPGRECKHRSSCLSCTWITRLATILTFLFGFVLNDNFSRNFTWLVLTFLFWFVLDYLEKAKTFPEIYLVVFSVDKSWPIDIWSIPDEEAGLSNCPVPQHCALHTPKHLFFSLINWSSKLLLTTIFVRCQSQTAITLIRCFIVDNSWP